MNNKLHIVSFDVPHPADYGGAIDVFYKIVALRKFDLKIHLHCFQYGRQDSALLNRICDSVTYYHREKKLKDWFSPTPFIVKTRDDDQLLQNLLSDEAPILFEGLHCTALLNHPALANRYKMVRTHNVEHDHYRFLSKSCRNLGRKIFLLSESYKLKAYESVLENAQSIFAISNSDTEHFDSIYKHTQYVPAFHGTKDVTSKPGVGEYLLFHGNLSVDDNIRSLNYILDKIKPRVSTPLIVAGRKPDKTIGKKIAKTAGATLVANPSQREMDKLIESAHVILLPTFQATGIKLKLLHSLSKGRHCVVNSDMIRSTGLDILCNEANSPDQWVETIEQLMAKTFDSSMIKKRRDSFSRAFNDIRNAKTIIQHLI